MGTSLQKSHSKASNFKLTMICFCLTIAISALWVGLSMTLNLDNKTLGIILLSAGGVFTLISMFLILKFTR